MTRATFLLAVTMAFAACSPSKGGGPEVGSQTNWLLLCESSRECGDLDCVCGACTTPCDGDAACADLPGASCIAATDEGSVALCSGRAPARGICLPRCEQTCGEGTSCVAGVCAPIGDATVRVAVDATVRHQTLVGFGASLAYADNVIVAHAAKAALYDVLFAESGLDVLRLRNRYMDSDQAALTPSQEIVAAATERLGRTPLLFMTSGSPPAALKANGSRECAGDPEVCTLASLPAGGFDYAGFADFWRASLEAYTNAGLAPDYISIQNNPNWVPAADAPLEACRFLPEEGMTTVTVDGAPVEVAYPGYREALAAVRAALATLPGTPPRVIAPEANALALVDEYAAALDASAFDALGIHLYFLDAMAIDTAAFASVRVLAEQLGHPVFQTEMRAEGLETAILIHHTLTAAGGSAYIQNDLVSWTQDQAPVALTLMTDDGAEAQGPYYALSHYAKSTDPGWVRVDATSDSTALLSSAWLSPDERALTVVLVNPGADDVDAELALPDELAAQLGRSQVMRTVFDGLERAAALGELPAAGVVRVPGRSILTVALAE